MYLIMSPLRTKGDILLSDFFFFCFFSAKLVRTITLLSSQIGQLYLVCVCMTIRRCVAYHYDLRVLTSGCGGPEVKTQKCMHKYYPDMYLILYCMTCFIVLYLIYVIYYACRFEKLLRAYVVLLYCYKMYRL